MMCVDDRVGSRELAPALEKLGMQVELMRLPFADVAFAGRGAKDRTVAIGVELKNLSDLCSSLRTGRLSGHQLPGLQAAYDYRWLVVEGQYGCDKAGYLTLMKGARPSPSRAHMRLDEVEGRLITLDLEGGLHVRHTSHRWQTLRFLVRLYRWWNDTTKDAHTSHLTPHQLPTLLPLSRFRQVVAQLPGVGLKASLAAERKFQTVARAMTATVDEWAGLETGGKRLGPSKAQAIVQFCREGL